MVNNRVGIHVVSVFTDLVTGLSPLLIILALQSWLLYLTYTPARYIEWRQKWQLHSEPTNLSHFKTLEEIMRQPIPNKQELSRLFSAYGGYYNVDSEVLRHIAKCESNYNPHAISGKYVGLYQFEPRTWIANRRRMGYDPDINLRFDAVESIKTAAYKIKHGGINAWPVCSRKVISRI